MHFYSYMQHIGMLQHESCDLLLADYISPLALLGMTQQARLFLVMCMPTLHPRESNSVLSPYVSVRFLFSVSNSIHTFHI
jgi:hypothetical protein